MLHSHLTWTENGFGRDRLPSMSKTTARGNARLTAPLIRAQKHPEQRLTMVTAYDAMFARLFDEAGIDILLVGDSLGMVIQGHASTLPVTMDDMLYHCRTVARGSERAHLVADMPFMSYQASIEDALYNAGRLLSEGGMQAVKLEGGQRSAPVIHSLTRIGIPVMAHIGLTPQSVHAMGGFRVQGRDAAGMEALMQDAFAAQDAGAYALVLEGMPSALAKDITHALTIPTIGIGAGPDCNGQVLVGYDLLGLSKEPLPRFVKPFASFYKDGVNATAKFIEEVHSGAFPAPEHSYESSQERPIAPSSIQTLDIPPRD